MKHHSSSIENNLPSSFLTYFFISDSEAFILPRKYSIIPASLAHWDSNCKKQFGEIFGCQFVYVFVFVFSRVCLCVCLHEHVHCCPPDWAWQWHCCCQQCRWIAMQQWGVKDTAGSALVHRPHKHTNTEAQTNSLHLKSLRSRRFKSSNLRKII